MRTFAWNVVKKTEHLEMNAAGSWWRSCMAHALRRECANTRPPQDSPQGARRIACFTTRNWKHHGVPPRRGLCVVWIAIFITETDVWPTGFLRQKQHRDPQDGVRDRGHIPGMSCRFFFASLGQKDQDPEAATCGRCSCV